MADFYTITARDKELPVAAPTPQDFTLATDGSGDPERLLSEPGWSPYCYDGTHVWFVRVTDVDLAAVPFVFMTQFEQADAVARLSPVELISLTDPLPIPQMAMIYSIGRCGTTLANHVLNASPDVWCLSEADTFDQVPKFGGDAVTLRALARFHFAIRSKPDATILGIKYRSQSLFHLNEINAAFPNAHNLFMYRDAVGWGNSFYAFADKLGAKAPYDPAIIGFMWELMVREPVSEAIARHPEFHGNAVEPGTVFALLWQKHLQAFSDARAKGVTITPLRYNELLSQSETAIAEMFRILGVPQIPLDAAMAAFEKDSQEGTIMGRSDAPARMTADQIAVLHDTLRNNGSINSADTVLV